MMFKCKVNFSLQYLLKQKKQEKFPSQEYEKFKFSSLELANMFQQRKNG